MTIVEKLPPYHKATSLCEVYVQHLTWFFRPIKKQELMEDFILPIYKAKHGEQDAPPLKQHSVAVLFLLFACSALFDLALPPHSDEAHKYYLLGKKALTMRSVFAQTELETVQAVLLMAMYQSLEGHRYSIDSAWCVLSLACKLGQRVRSFSPCYTYAYLCHCFYQLRLDSVSCESTSCEHPLNKL